MTALADFDLELSLKGNRDYVQGGDLYDCLMGHVDGLLGLDAVRDVRLLCRSIARRPLRAVVGEQSGESRGLLTFEHRGFGKVRLAIVDREGVLTARRPCPEERIVADSVADQASSSIALSVRDRPGFTLAEAIVALNKALHLRLFADHPGKWLFTEMRSQRPLVGAERRDVRVELVSRFGVRLTRSTIWLDSEEAGYICFSMKT